jgi:hypothetical protein
VHGRSVRARLASFGVSVGARRASHGEAGIDLLAGFTVDTFEAWCGFIVISRFALSASRMPGPAREKVGAN